MTEVRNASSAGEGKYQSYAEYIKVDVECLDEIPCHWQLHALKHALEIRITDGPHETPEFLDEGVPFVSAEAVSKGFIDFSKIRGYISVADDNRFSRKYSPRKFDIYMVKSGATTGITAIVETDEHFNIWSPLAVMRSNKDFEPYYLLNYLRSRTFRESVELNWSFGTQQNIGMGTLENLPICRPPIEEQRTIAAFLDYETARIDQLIAMQQRLIELLKEKRQAVISHAVTKGLNPNAPMKDSGVEWLGQVPEHWIVAKLKLNTRLMQTGPFGSQLHAEDYVDNGVPLINPAHMKNGEIVPDPQVSVDIDTQERLSQHKLSVGDIIFARRGQLGRCAVVKEEQVGWLCGTGSLKATLNERLIPEYAYLLITSAGVVAELSLESKGSTMENLNTETLGKVRLPVPPILEQRAILGYVDSVSGKYKKLTEQAECAIELMQERRTALISAAVTGKIDLRDWTPPKEG